MAREKWVMGRCGMAVLCMDMTFWTSDVLFLKSYLNLGRKNDVRGRICWSNKIRGYLSRKSVINCGDCSNPNFKS